ncbi:MAG: SEC-C domain-containing protein, partial [Clostridia bacterium]|nr:SEC-C domain-containing protein [Clostridia bacterium]
EKYKVSCKAEQEEVRALGGLFILGTERHESRRIDNQLRGRAGRQGDPGESRFFLSLEDDLMRLFGGERVNTLMANMGATDLPIEHKFITGAIESAQKRLESRNFQIRKNVLQYDDVMNRMREMIYGERLQVLNDADVSGHIRGMIDGVIDEAVKASFGEMDRMESTIELETLFGRVGYLIKKETAEELAKNWQTVSAKELTERLKDDADELYEKREEEVGSDRMRELERVILLHNVDEKWMDHIDAMHELRRGIGLRAYGQVDPVNAYKAEGFEMFDAMVASIREDTARMMYTFRLRAEEPKRRASAVVTSAFASGAPTSEKKQPARAAAKKIGPNDPCPCGSGKKYKKCHYLIDRQGGGKAE